MIVPLGGQHPSHPEEYDDGLPEPEVVDDGANDQQKETASAVGGDSTADEQEIFDESDGGGPTTSGESENGDGSEPDEATEPS